MARQKPWDKHEAAILLDAVIKVYSGEIERKQAISDVSNKLRKMAQGTGYEIDNVYRNIAGITFQMYSMESAYAGYTKVKPASKLFLEVVKIRNEQKDVYDVLLREAMDLAGITDSQDENINKAEHSSNDEKIEKIIQDGSDYIVDSEKRKKEFSKWIIDNGNAASTARQYVSALGTVSDIAKNNGIIQKDIYEIDDVDDIKNIIVKLMETPEFVDKNTTGHNRLSAVLTKYVQFSGDMSFDYKSTRARRGDAGFVIRNREYDDLNMRLKSMAKVYDDAKGFPIEWIHEKLGIAIGIEELEKSLANIPWVTEVKENVYSFSSKAEIQVEFDKEAFVEVLMQRYQHGMKMDSIDLEIFRDTYKDVTGNEIRFSDRDLIICLRNSGVIYKDRVFPAEGIINIDAREKLIEYITENFENGKKVLYYKSIYDDLKDVFAYCFNLTDAMMLKPYLEYICDSDDYYFSDEYISKEKDVELNHSDEIEEFLISAGMPLSYEDIYAGLSHIAKEIVHDEIKSNPNILLNGRENYFHYGIFEFSSEDADRITEYINDDIELECYSIWSWVFEKIKSTMPLFVENNIYLSSVGIRNAVAKKLKGRFNFYGEVICKNGQVLNMADVYRSYAEHHAPFSDDDIYNFAREVNGGVIYFNSISDVVVRVSKELFVSKDDIRFDAELIDSALSTYLSSGYLPIKDVDSFLVFPNVGYEWNAFLLENYLMYYSKKYELMNNGRSLNNVAGAVVKKGSEYTCFVDVCADVLSKVDFKLNKDKALDYLVQINLLTKRRYGDIDTAITKANQLRNRKE